MTRVNVLGLDGMSRQMLSRLRVAGLLPHLDPLLEAGRNEDLLSTVPFYTVPAWATMFTGIEPGQHGLLWWSNSDPELPWRNDDSSGYANINSTIRPPVWSLLTAAGHKVAVLDVPATFPAANVNGVFTSGFLAPWPHERSVWPASLYARAKTWPSPSGEVAADAPSGAKDVPAQVDAITEAMEARLGFFEEISMDPTYDLVIEVLVGPDRLSHLCWHDLVPDPSKAPSDLSRSIERFWRGVDNYLEIVAARRAAGDSVLIVSDHGSADPPRARFHSRSWLLQEGFIEASRRMQSLPPTVMRRLRFVRDVLRPILERRGSRRADRSFGIDSHRAQIVDLALGDRELGFFFAPQADRSVERRLIDALGRIEYDGRSLFEEVRPAEDFLGPIASPAASPAVMAVTRADVGVSPGSIFDPIFGPEPNPRRGIHQRDGILIFSSDIEMKTAATPEVNDITPTILQLLAHRPPTYMHGRSLVEVSDDLRPLPDINSGEGSDSTSLTSDEEESIANNLRDLGYIE